jgi:hypothetical protein
MKIWESQGCRIVATTIYRKTNLEIVSNVLHNRSEATIMEGKLKQLYTQLPLGTPVSSKDLSRLGISADLAVHYVRAGWLNRLARGVFSRPGDALSLYPALHLLESRVKGMHVGGKSALAWYNVRHYVEQNSTLHLFGSVPATVPEWFNLQFPSEYHQKKLFKESSAALLHVGSFENRSGAPQTSAPERALLELLSEVGIRQPLQEARELTEGTYTFRADVLRALLSACTSVKTVRLCLQLGQELSLPWVAKLDVKALPTGSKRPWVGRSPEGLLVLKP